MPVISPLNLVGYKKISSSVAAIKFFSAYACLLNVLMSEIEKDIIKPILKNKAMNKNIKIDKYSDRKL